MVTVDCPESVNDIFAASRNYYPPPPASRAMRNDVAFVLVLPPLATRRIKRRSDSPRAVIGGTYFAGGRRAINSGRTSRSLLNGSTRAGVAIFLIILGYPRQNPGRAAERRARDGYSINYNSRHSCRSSLRLFPMTPRSAVDKIARYLRSFGNEKRRGGKKGN